MRKAQVAVLAIILLLSWGPSAGVFAQEKADETGKLTIPWNEFKVLLDLGQDRVTVSLETFQKLLAQTGTKTTPPHMLAGGNVVLTRSEFENLVNQMKPPVAQGDQVPFEFLITRAVYSGTMRNNSTAFTARFTVHVLKKETLAKVPLLPSSTALQDLKVDGGPALLVTENGIHNVLLSGVGAHEVVATFSVTSPLDKGPHKIDLAIRPIPITLFTLEMPLKDVEVEIPQAQQVLTSTTGGTTSVKAVLAQANSISVRWRKKTAPTEKIPAKLYAEVFHLVSIEDDALRVTSDLQLNILYSEMDEIRVAVPKGIHVLSVTGEGIGERQEATHDDQAVIVIPFTYSRKGNVRVRVTTELPLSETGLGNVFTGMQVEGSVRETGFIGIVLNTSAEVIVAEKEGVEEIAVPRLPQQLVNQSAKPLTLGFKYLKHPYRLALDVKKHHKISVPVATINSANGVTLFTEDGKVVHRLIYQVRNSAKQFLEIKLPDNADVWSVFVNKGPVESSISAEGKLLVPLIRSHSVAGGLGTFPVEVIYCLDEDRFALMGSRGSTLPAVDLLVSQIIWSVYLPNDYAYHYFTSTLEKEEIIRGINILSGPARQYDERARKEISELGETIGIEDKMKRLYKGDEYASNFRNVPLEEQEIAGQMNAELDFGGRLNDLAQSAAPATSPVGGTGAGVLPIQIQVPTGGQVYRFARTIIKPDDPLTFSVTYSRGWVTGGIKWVLVLLGAWLLYLNRRSLVKLWQWLSGYGQLVAGWYKKHEGRIAKAAQSQLAPFVLFGGAIVLWPLFPALSLLLFFGFWLSLAYHLLNYWKKREQARPAAPKSSGTKGPTA
jgi:hypothetical protein